jgi:hypothetical protein
MTNVDRELMILDSEDIPISVKEACNVLQSNRTETEVKIYVYLSLLNLCLRYFRSLCHPVLLRGYFTH